MYGEARSYLEVWSQPPGPDTRFYVSSRGTDKRKVGIKFREKVLRALSTPELRYKR
jgi:hypothetical protein